MFYLPKKNEKHSHSEFVCPLNFTRDNKITLSLGSLVLIVWFLYWLDFLFVKLFALLGHMKKELVKTCGSEQWWKAGCTSVTFPLCLLINEGKGMPRNGRIIWFLLSLRICSREMYLKYTELASAFWVSQPTSQSKHLSPPFRVLWACELLGVRHRSN